MPPGRKPKPQPTKPSPPKSNPFGTPTYDPKSGFTPHDPVSTAVRAAQHPDRDAIRLRTIIRRQQLLRSLGFYHGEVDGVWGQQSQKAWSIYVYRRNHDRLSVAPYISPQQVAAQAKADVQQQHVADAQRAAADAIDSARRGVNPQTEANHLKQVRQLQAKADARKALVVQQREIEQDAARLRANPAAASTFDLHRLSVVMTNHKVKWDEPTYAKVVQTWLNTHGHPVEQTGKWDAATNDAIQLALHQEAHRQQVAAEHAVVRDFYANGRLIPGTHPDWWPMDTPVPKPGDLLKTLQQGGFLGDVLLRQLIEHSNIPDNAWRQWQHDQIQRSVQALLGPFARPDFLIPKGSGGDVADLLMAMDVAPAPGKDKNHTAPNALDERTRLRLTEQNKVLLTSSSFDEFHRRLAAHLRVADQKFVELQAERAKHKPWWGKTVEIATAPGEFLRTAAVADVYMGMDLLSEGHLRDRADYWEGAQQGIEGSNPFLRFGFVMLADPLTFVRPFRMTSTLIRYGTRGTQYEALGLRFGAYDLGRQATRFVGPRSVPLLGSRGLRAVTYDGALWHQPIAKGISAIAHDTPVLRTFIRQKEAVVDAANTAIIRHATHLFGDVGSSRFARVATFPIRAATRGAVERVYEQLAPKLADQLGPVYEELRATRTSLYANDAHTARSNVGEALVARYLEDGRAQEAFRMANESAGDVVARALTGGIPQDEYLAAVARHHGDIEAALAELKPELPPLSRAGAAELGRREYQRVLDGVGVFLTGGSDPDLAAELSKRMAKHRDLITRVILPSLQRMLVNDAKDAGIDLFDEGGVWAFRNGDAAQNVKALATDAFAASNLVERPNPLYGKELSWSDGLHVIEDEVRVAQGRLLSWFDRQEAIGNRIPEDVRKRMLADRRASVEDNFVMGDGSPHAVLNRNAFGDLAEMLGLPKGLRVRFERRVDQPEAAGLATPNPENLRGYYDPLTQEAVVRIDHGLLDRAAMHVNAAVEAEREFAITLAHEARHAFQDIVQEIKFAEQASIRYFDRPIEIDARAFADAWMARGGPNLIQVVRPRPGYMVDTRPSLSVPDLYARINPAFRDGAQIADPGRMHFGGGQLSWIAQNPLEVGGRSLFDTTIGRLVWNLGGKHDDAVYGEIKQGLAVGRKENPVQADLHTGSHDPGSRRFDSQNQHDRIAAADLRKTITDLHETLARAEDEALPHALLKSHAYMAALSEATSTPGRVAYKLVQGGLQAWIFATLPFRLGWVVRNVADNTLKTLIAGARDPRAYVSHWVPGATGVARTVFEAGVGEVYELAQFADRLFGTSVAPGYKAAMDSFWHHTTETIDRVFQMHGWQVPKEVLDGARFRVFDQKVGARPMLNATLDQADPSKLAKAYTSFRDGFWKVMANTPENYYKKVLYNDQMAKLTADGVDPIRAHQIAWKKVEDTLFDYSKVTVAEDNLRIFFPFIQFWRKNTAFWAKTAVSEPWVAPTFLAYQQERDRSHADWPGWMRRYVNMQEVADAASVVPGLQFLVEHTGISNAQFDPLSFISFNAYYRAWKDRNENLAPEDGTQPGGALGFLRTLLDGLDQYSGGLSINPFLRKPLESAHIASPRAWQSIFPQTPLVAALTRKYVDDRWANRVLDWERIFTLGLGTTPSDELADNFNFYVQREMAGQVARGETPNRALAEEHIRAWFLTQNVWGYFAGTYFRKNTPEDYYLSKLTDEAVHNTLNYDDLSQKDRTALTIWSQAKKLMGDPLAFDRYIEALPYIQSYYKLGREDRQQLLQDHPEISGYVHDGVGRAKTMSGNFLSGAGMYLKGAEFFAADDLATVAGLPFETRQAIQTYLVTPELQAYWDQHASTSKTRRTMEKAEMYGYLLRLQKTYFAIPETDYAARDAFLDEHPELGTFWAKNDNAADDYRSVMNHANAALRDVYFHIVQSHGGSKGGFAAAAPFLHDHPFIFEGTSSAGKIDAHGNWKVTTAHGRAYLAAKPALEHFFGLLKTANKKVAYAWLNSDAPEAKVARDYFEKWGKHTSHSRDYLRAKPYLQAYFNMPKDERGKWLRGGSDGAKVVAAYFQKWGHKNGLTAHAKDFLAVKPALDYYFKLSPAAREKWLHSHDPRAAAVLAYFKQYGHANRVARAWQAAADKLHLVTDPELRRRAEFWTLYFSLTPDQRPQFIHDHAEQYGVFVFGALHEGQRHDSELEFIRKAMAAKLTINGKPYHLSEREATYLYAKPLLDVFATLGSSDKQLFIQANPEIAEYLDAFSRKSLTGNKQLDAQIERYFALPQGSQLRADFLHAHPEVQGYFDQHSTAAELAIRNVLNVYFGLAPGRERQKYLENHPEINAYFDRKKRERDTLKLATDAFEQADPILKPYFEAAGADLVPSGERMRAALRRAHIHRFQPQGVESRRDRTPAADSTL